MDLHLVRPAAHDQLQRVLRRFQEITAGKHHDDLDVPLGWYYQQGGEHIGPVSSDDIARLVGCGQLRPAEEVWKAWKDVNNKVRFFGSQADPERGRLPRRVP